MDASADSSLPQGDGAPAADTSAPPPPPDGAEESGLADTGAPTDASQGTSDDASDAADGSLDAGDAGPPVCTGNGYDAGANPNPDGGAEGAACNSDDDCAPLYWCSRVGSCTGPGKCAGRQVTLYAFDTTLTCGCDGQTYMGLSTAAGYWMNEASGGACPNTPKCTSNGDCGCGARFCLKPIGQCGAEGICVVPSQGTCVGGSFGAPSCPCPGAGHGIEDECALYEELVNIQEPAALEADGGFVCN